MADKPAMHKKNRPFNQRLGQVLITLDVVNYVNVIKARQLQIAQKPPVPIGRILIELGYITAEDLNRALSLQKDLDIS
ncbi:MAG TPA: hypothetical protein VF399_06625 [bacterium]